MKQILKLANCGSCLFLTAFIFFQTAFFNAQEQPKLITGFAINPKAGIYAGIQSSGTSFGGELNLMIDKVRYSIDFYRCDELLIIGPSPAEQFNNLGIMLGKHIGDKFFRFQYQAGFSAFWGTKRTDYIAKSSIWGSSEYYSRNFLTLGIPMKLGCKIVPLPTLSIGLDFHVNLNLEQLLFVPMISVEFGKIRSKILTTKDE